jgi:hypothetical protein
MIILTLVSSIIILYFINFHDFSEKILPPDGGFMVNSGYLKVNLSPRLRSLRIILTHE